MGVRARVDAREAQPHHAAPLVRNIRQTQHDLKKTKRKSQGQLLLKRHTVLEKGRSGETKLIKQFPLRYERKRPICLVQWVP